MQHGNQYVLFSINDMILLRLIKFNTVQTHSQIQTRIHCYYLEWFISNDM